LPPDSNPGGEQPPVNNPDTGEGATPLP